MGQGKDRESLCCNEKKRVGSIYRPRQQNKRSVNRPYKKD